MDRSDGAHRASDFGTIPIREHRAAAGEVDVQRGDVRAVPPTEPNRVIVVGFDLERAVECRVDVAQPDEIHDPADDRPVEGVLDLARRVVVPVDGATLARPNDGLVVVRAGQETHVVDLGNPSREELDRASGKVSIIVLTERRVVGAIELVDIARFGVLVGQDAVDVATLGADPIGEVGHLLRRQDAIEVRADGDAVMTVEVRELPAR